MNLNIKHKLHNLTSDKNFLEILVGSAYAVAAQIMAVGLTMIANIIVARVYGAESVGILAMVNFFLLLISIIAIMGTDITILRIIPEYVAKHSVAAAFQMYRNTQYFVSGVAAVLGVVFFFASDFVATSLFSKPNLSFYFSLAAVLVVFKSLMELNINAARGLRLIRTFAVMQVIPAAAMLAILIAGTILFPGPGNPVYAQLVAYGISAILGIWIMNRAFKARVQPEETVDCMRLSAVLAISTPMLVTVTMLLFISQTGVIMLGIFRTESEVGYFSIAGKLASLTSFILQAINTIAAPKFSELFHTGRIDELFYVAKKSTKLIFWITLPIFVILIVYGRPILSRMFGEGFASAYPALIMLVAGQFVSSIAGSTGYFMNMTGHQKMLRNIITVAALINVILCWVLVPRYGINGAAFSGMISLTFWNVFVLIYIKNKYGMTIGYVPNIL